MGSVGRCSVLMLLIATASSCDRTPRGIEEHCRQDYSDAACRCFDGILAVQLSPAGYLGYQNALDARPSRLRFDGGVAQERLQSRDKRVCIDASDICGVPACQPDVAPPSTCRFPDGRCETENGGRTWR